MHCVRLQLIGVSSLSSRIAIDEREMKNAPVFDENLSEGKPRARCRLCENLRLLHRRSSSGKKRQGQSR